MESTKENVKRYTYNVARHRVTLLWGTFTKSLFTGLNSFMTEVTII